jgi:hypothetical protein
MGTLLALVIVTVEVDPQPATSTRTGARQDCLLAKVSHAFGRPLWNPVLSQC